MFGPELFIDSCPVSRGKVSQVIWMANYVVLHITARIKSLIISDLLKSQVAYSIVSDD